MVICLERGADLHMAQLMPLPLNVSCFSKIQIVFTFLVPADPGSPGKRAVKRVCDQTKQGEIYEILAFMKFITYVTRQNKVQTSSAADLSARPIVS